MCRILITDIEIKNLKYKYYNWLLIEQFDTNVYVDLNEIKQTQYVKNYTSIFSNRISTETAEYMSLPFNLFLFIQNDKINCDYSENNEYLCILNVKLPLHARYQRAQSQTKSINFTLNKPKLFVRNLNDNKTNDLINLDQLTFENNIKFPCKKLNIDYLSEMNHRQSVEICDWTNLVLVESQNDTTDELLTIQIPVGDKDYEIIVLIVTLVIVMFVALSVARCVSKKVQSVRCVFNHKLKSNKDNEEEEEED